MDFPPVRRTRGGHLEEEHGVDARRVLERLSRCVFSSNFPLTLLFERAEALRFAVMTLELLFQRAGLLLRHKQRIPVSGGVLI